MGNVNEDIHRIAKDNGMIAILWHKDDIIMVAKDREIDLNDQQAVSILESLKLNHDCNLGITWDTVRSTIESEVNND